jgi:hypothetical protein
VSRRPSSPRPHPEAGRRLARALAIVVAFVAMPARALAQYEPDEVPLVMASKDAGGGVALEWGVPAIPPTSGYNVRRCALASLRAGYFGNCIAAGLPATSYVDAGPGEGDVFYLVAGTFGGLEASLGVSDARRFTTPRMSAACNMPDPGGPLDLVVRLTPNQLVCGSQVVVEFASGVLTLLTGDCSGVQAGFFAQTAERGDFVEQICGSAVGSTGSGEIMRIHFDRGPCPLAPSSFQVRRCLVVVGGADCGDVTSTDQQCILRVQ